MQRGDSSMHSFMDALVASKQSLMQHQSMIDLQEINSFYLSMILIDRCHPMDDHASTC